MISCVYDKTVATVLDFNCETALNKIKDAAIKCNNLAERFNNSNAGCTMGMVYWVAITVGFVLGCNTPVNP